MTARQLTGRLIAAKAGVNLNCLGSSLQLDDMPEVKQACALLAQSQIFIDDTPPIDIQGLRAKAASMRRLYGVQAIFIDYLQLIHVPAQANCSRASQFAEISSSLKAMARELDIPVIVLLQLHRTLNDHDLPRLDQLPEAGAVKQFADIFAILHRDHDQPLSATLAIAKNQRGPCATVNLDFFPQLARFENAARDA